MLLIFFFIIFCIYIHSHFIIVLFTRASHIIIFLYPEEFQIFFIKIYTPPISILFFKEIT